MPIITFVRKASERDIALLDFAAVIKCGETGSPNYSFNSGTVAGQITLL